ncbi:MAG: precorrin-6A reductase [Clostridiales bacterium]|nr:precorrin-6A reductase [Clostridiales bacterium]
MNLLLFGGTKEGRELAEELAEYDVIVHYSTATGYGGELLPSDPNLLLHTGRMDEEEMCTFMKEHDIDQVVDATHPYAVIATRNIQAACKTQNVPYIRVWRPVSFEEVAGMVVVPDVRGAVEYLSHTKGTVFITTGSKELREFQKLPDYKERCYARVLSTKEVMDACCDMGFHGKNLCCMQGPFSMELNLAQFRMTHARYLVTKASGKNGGFLEKIQAAKEACMTVVVIKTPEENNPECPEEKGVSKEEALKRLITTYHLTRQREVVLLSIGPGGNDQFTVEAVKALSRCQVVIGAGRMLEACKRLLELYGIEQEKCYVSLYKKEEIVSWLECHPHYKNIVLAYSGDSGFYSGANGMERLLNGKAGTYRVKTVSGIASPIYFLGRIGVPWEGVTFESIHGKDLDVADTLRKSHRLCLLLSDGEDGARIAKELCQYGYEDTKMILGESLSYPDERITVHVAKNYKSPERVQKLALVYLELSPEKICEEQKPLDERILRSKVPMTKEEVRLVSLGKLALEKGCVVYDIGAGTGSVSIACALSGKPSGIYALEKKEEALKLLHSNVVKFHTDSIHVIPGEALHTMEELPAPTHAFIGGSGGNLTGILKKLVAKNPSVRIVVNAITQETVSTVLEAVREGIVIEKDWVTIQVSRSRKVSGYHMMNGENPVTVITLTGKEET